MIKLEYYLGAGVWKAVLVAGLLFCLASLFMPSFTASALLGIFGGSVIWGATELPAQAERANRGYFPGNTRRNNYPFCRFGLTTITTIAAGHVLVRRLYARFGTRPAAPLFLLSAMVLLASVISSNNLLSGLLGITGITVFWDGIELFRQQRRVRRLKS